MGTIALLITVAIVASVATAVICKRKEQKISVTVMSAERKQADELFAKQVADKIPASCLKVSKFANGTTEYQFTLKRK